MPLPFRDVTIYNRKQKEWWENMEEIIGLSKSKVEFEEIWKRFHCALFVVLLIYGLYYTAEKYERILVRPDEAWKVRTRTEAVNGIGDLKVSDAEMLISLDPLSVPDKFEGREMWKNPNTESVPETEKSLDITASGVNTTDASESPAAVESESGVAADSAGETTVPAVLTIYLHGNGGTPEIMTLTELQMRFRRRVGVFRSVLEKSLTAGI